MADEINYSNINEKFPLAGKDNDSQVFRNNFTIIKENWELAKTLFETLDSTTAKIDGTNDFGGNQITNAVLADLTYKVDITRINGVRGDAVGNIYVNKADGIVHVIKAKDDLRINVQGFDDIVGYQFIRLLITTDDGPRRCDIVNPTTGGTISSNLPIKDTFGNPIVYALPGDVVTATIVDVFTFDGGNTLQAYIYTDYSGFLDDGTLPGDEATTIEQLAGAFPLPDFYEPEGTTDSFNGVVAGPINADGTPAVDPVATNLLYIQDPDGLGLCDQFFVGQKLRINGGIPLFDADGNTQTAESVQLDIEGLAISTVESSVVSDIDAIIYDNTATPEQIDASIPYQYRIHEIDIDTGQIGNGVTSAVVNVKPDAVFDIQRYLKVTFNRSLNTRGILVFRSVNNGDFLLTDILGPKQLGGNTAALIWQDYAGVSHVDWSQKVLSDTAGRNFNYYNIATGMNHFPIVSPSNVVDIKGWMDVTIIEKSACNPDGSFVITLDVFGIFDSSVTINLDDTFKLQTEIDKRALAGSDRLRLSNRVYNVTNLTLPNNFKLSGSGSTTLRKSDWSLGANANIITASDPVPVGIAIEDIIIDGNQQNNYLRNDTGALTGPRINFAIDLAVADDIDIAERQSLGQSLPGEMRLNNVKITNCIGGGVYIPSVRGATIRDCVITNSGMSDIYDYGPLFIEAGLDFIVTDNKFSNHAGSVNISVSERGAFANNIVNACGQGVEVFAAKFLLSSPNVLIGPNNEFLSGPDIFNSEYDLVNIKLTEDTQFSSDRIVYQENGDVVDLLANNGSLEGKIYQLRKVDNVEELYSELTVPRIDPDDPTTIQYVSPIQMEFSPSLASSGEFAFQIINSIIPTLHNFGSDAVPDNKEVTITDVNYILKDASVTNLRDGSANPDSSIVLVEDPNHTGLVYRIIHRSFTPIATSFSGITATGGGSTLRITLPGSTQGLIKGTAVQVFGYAATVGTSALNTITGTITQLSYIPGATAAQDTTVVEITYGDTFVNDTITQIDGEDVQLSTETSQILVSGRVN